MSINFDILDVIIGHRIDLNGYSNLVVRDIIRLLNQVDRDIYIKMQSSATPNNIRCFKSLMKDIKSIIESGYGTALSDLETRMNAFADLESKYVAGILPVPAKTITAEALVAIVSSTPITVGESGKLLLEEIFKSLSAGKEQRIRQTIRMSMVEGETIDDMVRRLRGTKANQFKDGIMAIDRRNAEAMVRTVVNHTANQTAQLVYNNNDDIIKAVQWHSTLDSRTTPVCRARDGKLFPLDSGPRPPAHVNCRSFMIPVLKSWKELGIDAKEMLESTRASMDGQVPESTTYGTWLKSKSPAFIKKVLGKSRAEMFINGELDIEDFVNDKGRLITLKELKNKT